MQVGRTCLAAPCLLLKKGGEWGKKISMIALKASLALAAIGAALLPIGVGLLILPFALLLAGASATGWGMCFTVAQTGRLAHWIIHKNQTGEK